MNTGPKTGKKPLFFSADFSIPNLSEWTALEGKEWVADMRACLQEPEFHGEGDVWTHTCMVRDALSQLPEFQTLGQHEKEMLWYAVLLHDVAKPLCTIVEDGKISSPGHAKLGEKIAREILWDADFAFRERVCALVRLHGLPLWGFEKPNPVRAAMLAAGRIANQLTYTLAKADVLGRICATQADFLYRLELYKELCLENNCFTGAPDTHNAHSRFRYYWSDETYLTEIFDDTAFEVIILCGIAGSGKDTVYQKHYKHLPCVSLDAIRKELKIKPDDREGQGRVAQLAYERAKAFCRAKQSFVWNSTNLTRDMRARLIGALSVYRPRFVIEYVEAPLNEIYQRRRADIKVSVLQRMIRQLDIPLEGEAHELRVRRSL